MSIGLKLFIIIGFLLSISPLLAQIYYINELEKDKCKCSEDWKRDYIQIFTLIALIYIIIIAISVYFEIDFHKNKIINFLLRLGGLVNMILLYVYIRKLKEIECGCALEHENMYIFLKYYSLFGIIFMVFSILRFVYNFTNMLMNRK